MREKGDSSSRLSTELKALRELCHEDKVSFRMLLEKMNVRSHGLLTLFLCLPFLFPVPLPGLSVLIGLAIFLAAIAQALGKKPWMPKKILDTSVPNHFLEKVFGYGEKASRKLEKIIRPRGEYIVQHPWVRPVNSYLIAACGLLLAMPLPPGTNFPPAVAIFLLSLAGLEDDILLMVLGYVAVSINVVLFGGMVVFGKSGILYLWNSF